MKRNSFNSSLQDTLSKINFHRITKLKSHSHWLIWTIIARAKMKHWLDEKVTVPWPWQHENAGRHSKIVTHRDNGLESKLVHLSLLGLRKGCWERHGCCWCCRRMGVAHTRHPAANEGAEMRPQIPPNLLSTCLYSPMAGLPHTMVSVLSLYSTTQHKIVSTIQFQMLPHQTTIYNIKLQVIQYNSTQE